MTRTFRQAKPFRPLPIKTSGTSKSRSIAIDKHPRQFVAILRLPILAVAPTLERSIFRGWERGHKVSMTVSARNRTIGRATVEDAYVLSYVASRATETFNARLCPGMFVEIEPRMMLEELGMPADPAACERVIASLRRLVMTDLRVYNWGDRAISEMGPLLPIEPCAKDKRRFLISVPDWLQDEIQAPRIATIPPEALTFSGFRARLYGWAQGRVGQKLGDARFITQREALTRLGPIPPGTDPWDAILAAAVADDVPGYGLGLEAFDGQPAIAVRRRIERTPVPMSEGRLTIELEFGAEASESGLEEKWHGLLSTSAESPVTAIEI